VIRKPIHYNVFAYCKMNLYIIVYIYTCRSSHNDATSATTVFQESYADLVMSLPMDDCIFVAQLFTHGLITANLKESLNLQKKTSEKATDFLDNLQRIGTDFHSVFDKLLTVMENCEYGRVKDISKNIRAKMNENEDNIKGNCRSISKQARSQKILKGSPKYGPFLQ